MNIAQATGPMNSPQLLPYLCSGAGHQQRRFSKPYLIAGYLSDTDQMMGLPRLTDIKHFFENFINTAAYRKRMDEA